jgi:alcohol dehydrogenase
MQKNFIGVGSLNNLRSIIDKHNAKKVLIVTGKKSFLLSGAQEKIKEMLSDIEVVAFHDFQSNPKIEDVIKGVRLARSRHSDLIIAIGGGSVIDMAKLIRILSCQNNNNIIHFINNPKLILSKGVPLVAIPTTFGSGSEATHFAVVYIEKKKHSLAHGCITPDYSILDSELSYSLPKELAASSGIDALSQAVESYWSIKSTPISKKYSLEAISLIIHTLKRAILGDKHSINDMLRASNLAGKAINITTTTAPHAISYPLTTFFGIQHGHAVALILGYFFEINSSTDKYKVQDPRGEKYLLKTMNELFDVFSVNTPKECFEAWQNLMKSIGLETSFCKMGVCSNSDRKIITNNVNLQRLSNNPVEICDKVIAQILLSSSLNNRKGLYDK